MVKISVMLFLISASLGSVTACSAGAISNNSIFAVVHVIDNQHVVSSIEEKRPLSPLTLTHFKFNQGFHISIFKSVATLASYDQSTTLQFQLVIHVCFSFLESFKYKF